MHFRRRAFGDFLLGVPVDCELVTPAEIEAGTREERRDGDLEKLVARCFAHGLSAHWIDMVRLKLVPPLSQKRGT